MGTPDGLVASVSEQPLVSHIRMAEIVAALMWGPKKDKELMEIAGMTRNHLSRCVEALQSSGVIYRTQAVRIPGKPGRPEKPWALQIKPFEMKDEQ